MRITISWTHLVVATAAALLVSGCSEKKPEATAPAPQPTAATPAPAAPVAAPAADAKVLAAALSPEAKKEAEDLFSTRCALCHGPNGDGKGPTAAALNPPPRNFHDAAWQLMPPNPDLVGKPAVQALRAKVRSFRN